MGKKQPKTPNYSPGTPLRVVDLAFRASGQLFRGSGVGKKFHDKGPCLMPGSYATHLGGCKNYGILGAAVL